MIHTVKGFGVANKAEADVSLELFCFFGNEACGILTPWPGIKPAPSALEGGLLNTGPPQKS